MILAAGMGLRLKPQTDDKPKALVPVAGVPMLQHIILKMKAAGYTHLTINIHHFGEQIINFLKANHDFGLTIHISDERKALMDTGGAVKQARCFLQGSEPFLVHNTDIFSNVDLNAMYEAHVRSQALVTLLVNRRPSARQLLFDEANRLRGWRNHETGQVKSNFPDFDPSHDSEYAFGGVQVLSPAVFSLLESWTGKFSLIDFYLCVCPQHPVCLYTEDFIRIIDAGKQPGLTQAEQEISRQK